MRLCIATLSQLLILVALPAAAAQPEQAATRLDTAIIEDRRDPATAVDMAADRPRHSEGAQTIRLPHRLHRPDGNLQGVFWYRVDLPPLAAMPANAAIFLPRLTDGGTFYLNGAAVLSIPAADALKRVRWRRARAFVLPAHLLKLDGNVLQAKIISRDFTVDFPHLLLGPAEELQELAESRQWIDRYGSQFTGVTALVVGVFILCIWWFRRSERYYLLFGLSSLLWAVRTLNYSVETMPAEAWWWWRAGNFLVVAAATATLAGFFLSFADLDWRRWRWLVAVHAIIGPLAVVASEGRLHEAVYSYWQGILFLVIISALVRFAWWGYHHRSIEVLLITIGMMLSIMLAANDYATVSGISAHTRVYTLHLALPVLLLTIGALLTIRFVRALRNSEEANALLAQRLAEKERELATHFESMRLVDRGKASAAERQRIMQDMHDGLGAQLVSSLVMVERGGAQPADIAMLLRESLDEMRLAIDAFGQAEIDLNGALAGLRHRMEPRLIAAGIAVEWTMDDAFAALQLDEHMALQLLRIVQEVLSNVIKHSRASSLSVRFEADRRYLRIVIADNGGGFTGIRDHQGRGLSGIRKRAHEIGGDVDIEASPQGTTVVVRCPLPADPISRSAVAA